MQKSPPTPSATSWSSRAAAALFQRDVWLCAGEIGPESGAGPDSDTGTHPSLRALGRAELTIYIVEDSAAVKERLIESVEDIPHARVVGSADAVNDALEGMRALQPRVLILDIQLRGGSGFRLLKLMRAAGMTRQRDVEHYHIDLQPLAQLLQGLLRRAGLAYHLQIRLLREHLAHAGAQDRMIVDDHDLDRRLHLLKRIPPFVLSRIQHHNGTSVSSPWRSVISTSRSAVAA
jgi:CheY-like chemotaxis protein